MKHRRQSQRGYVAIFLLAVFCTLGATWVVTGLGAGAVQNERDRKTAAVLGRAKQAVIGRATVDASLPGSLPCPDLLTNIAGTNIPNDGIADLFAGSNCPSYIGRLPWRTLGLDDLRDADGERLWYALSPNFRDFASQVLINDATTGSLSVTGESMLTNVVAVIFAPGAALNSQLRGSVSEKNSVINYLDGANAAGGSAFVSPAPDAKFNDRLVAITVADLISFVERRVAKETTVGLSRYFSAHSILPNPALVSDFSCQPHGDPSLCLPSVTLVPGFLPRNLTPGVGWPGTIFPTWFNANWRTSVGYTVAPECTSLPPCLNTTFSAVTDAGIAPPKVTLVIGTMRQFTVRVIAP
ncbi:MAG: hypothetical protein JWN94_4798 [Betaproteobacteria bacterium]|nr:hypothetical protein [Betaproteobacteria bacterium]